MTNPKSTHSKEFDKHHQKERLETLIMKCWNCNIPRTHIYLGDFGNKQLHKYTYKCSGCDAKYISSRRLN